MTSCDGFHADEEKWMLIVINSHDLFCNCKDVKGHLNKLFRWDTTEDSGAVSGEGQEDSGDHGGEPTDLAILAALAEEEATEEDARGG